MPAAPTTTDWKTLGTAIRDRRRDQALTLVALAEATELSQPFLSQIENGRAKPSMESLYRIARALGTTPQAFLGGPSTGTAPLVTRAAQARSIPASDRAGSECHVLLGGATPFHVLEYDGLTPEFREYWEHDGFEAVYVVAGTIEADIDGEVTRLSRGDVISYSARRPHRLRSVGRGRARVLMVETKVEAVQDQRPASHATR